MNQDEKEKQDKIDSLYGQVWDLIDDIDSLKHKVLEVGEEMKELVSPEVFK